jgi:hypothetical protein
VGDESVRPPDVAIDDAGDVWLAGSRLESGDRELYRASFAAKIVRE